MDGNSESSSVLHPFTVVGSENGGLPLSQSDLPMVCVLCQSNEAVDLEASICGDCKFLFFEEFGSPTPTPTLDPQPRTTTSTRRTRHGSSESIEMFSLINLARQSQPTGSDQENQSADTDASARFFRQIRARTTPNGSRRFRRVISDTESDGFESLNADSESNISFSGNRLFRYESDTISYGEDSDASVDGPSIFINREDGGSDTDTDTDIDPMRAGLDLWRFDEPNGVGVLNEWDDPYPFAELVIPGGPLTRRRQFDSSELAGTGRLRRVRPTYVDETQSRWFTFDEPRGAPPAAVSCVSSLPRVVINEEQHGKLETLACAICKDVFSVGTVVNQLPCSHLYHSCCILPWLNSRNTCPLCRYELPTDDKEYEERKGNLGIHQSQEAEEGSSEEDSSSDSNSDGDENENETHEEEVDRRQASGGGRGGGGGGWQFLVAAAPIVSCLGFALLLWVGDSQNGRASANLMANQGSGVSWRPNQRESRGSRKWWPFF